MVFPVVMYRCESWTRKKAEHQRIDAFELVLEKTPESSLDCKEIKAVHPKGNQPLIFVGKTEGGERRGRQRMRWLDGITD